MMIKNTPAKILLIFAFSVLSQACNLIPLKEGIQKDGEISSSTRDKLHALTDTLFRAIKAENLDAQESMLSAELLENNYNKRTRQLIGNHLKVEKYTLVNDYYAVNKAENGEFKSVNTDSLGINFKPVTRETYIAFYLPKQSSNQHMITLVYGKFDYGWRIDKIEFELYARNGKTAAQLFDVARSQYAKGYLADAVNTMAGAMECASPSQELIQPDHTTTSSLYNRVVNQANDKYKFPMVLDAVPGKPAIFRIGTRELNDGTYPVVSYLSKISIKDTTALKQQNNAVKKVIGNVFKGINKDKKHLIYFIYNEKPNSHENAYNYTVIDNLK